MNDKRVRMGVVGVGGMGTNHCKTCQTLDEVELTAVADISPERAREIGERFSVPYFSDYRELIGGGLAEAVIVATPHFFHPPVAIAAFEAGLHVLSEKPIAVRVSMAEKMAEAARKSGKVFSVMFQMRTTAQVKRALELVRGGQLGEVRRTLLISPEFRSQAYYNSGTWRATWAGEGGGVLLNQAPHAMDLFVALGGMPKKVYGRCETLMHEIEVEDQAVAMLEYENGATGYFYTSTCEMDGRIMEIVGDAGKLQLGKDGVRFWRYEPTVSEFNRINTEMWGRPTVVEVESGPEVSESGHRGIIHNFARAILHGEPLIAPGEAGVQSLELANAIILSSHKGEPVDIPIDREEYDRLIEDLRSTSSFKDEWGESEVETDPEFQK